MPLFYFHLRSSIGLERDEIGFECADLDAAYLEACRTIPGLAAELIQGRHNPMEYIFEIADIDGMMLLEVPFTETVRGARKPPLPPSHGLRLINEVERAHELVASVCAHVALLQAKMQESRELLKNVLPPGRRE